MPKRATKTSFVKGKSPNPGGVPKGGRPPEFKDKIAAAKAKFQDLLPAAFDVLDQMFNAEFVTKAGKREPNMALRTEAMHIVLNRNLGMVVERKEISGADGGAIKIEDNTPSVRLLLQSALIPLTIDAKEDEKGEK